VYARPIGSAGSDQKYLGFPTGAKLVGLHTNAEPGVAYRYEWNLVKGSSSISSPTSLTTNISPKEVETEYELTIRTPNEESCELVDNVVVKFEVVITPPLIFSPNGDGKNDLWEIAEMEFFPDARVEIYNQWGTKVYEKGRGYFNEPWDGKNEGVEVPIATYYYIITPNKIGYEPKAGSVTIVR
jgi:gliding motility-associated-like protein